MKKKIAVLTAMLLVLGLTGCNNMEGFREIVDYLSCRMYKGRMSLWAENSISQKQRE